MTAEIHHDVVKYQLLARAPNLQTQSSIWEAGYPKSGNSVGNRISPENSNSECLKEEKAIFLTVIRLHLFVIKVGNDHAAS
jgi:hypothetical protein